MSKELSFNRTVNFTETVDIILNSGANSVHLTGEPGVGKTAIQNVLVERTGYRKMLEEEGTEDARTRLGNLDELLNAAADASERGEGLREFLDHAALVSDADSTDERAPVSLPDRTS